MEIVIIGASILAFILYISFYRYFGVESKIHMVALHSLVLVLIAGLAVLLAISISGDYGNVAITSAIAAITGFGLIIVKYVVAEFGSKLK